MKVSKVNKMVVVAMLSGLAYILMLFDIPIIPNPIFSFLKLDFSDIPILISMSIFGPIAGVLTAFLKCTLYFFTKSPTLLGFLGAFASFMASVLYSLPIYYLFKWKRESKKESRIFKGFGIFLGTLSLTVSMAVMNYFVLLPLYSQLAGFNLGMSYQQVLLLGIVPFNLVKGLIVGLAFMAVYTKLLPWLAPRLTKDKKISNLYKR